MLTINNLKKSYENVEKQQITVLSLDEFEMDETERIALIGPSGSGKSTLLNCIAGITRPTAGEINLLGTDILRLSEEKMDAFRACHIGYVFQNFNLIPGFSALENVMLSMQFSNVIPGKHRKRKAEELLEQVGLGHRFSHRPHQLSNGEQQRVAIARALANEPSLVLADEPTASLDNENAQVVISLLTKICQQNNTGLLLCTHDLTLVENLDRCVNLGPSKDWEFVAEQEIVYV